MNHKLLPYSFSLLIAATALICIITPARAAEDQKPNIVVIMGDDVGWFNIGAYYPNPLTVRAEG